MPHRHEYDGATEGKVTRKSQDSNVLNRVQDQRGICIFICVVLPTPSQVVEDGKVAYFAFLRCSDGVGSVLDRREAARSFISSDSGSIIPSYTKFFTLRNSSSWRLCNASIRYKLGTQDLVLNQSLDFDVRHWLVLSQWLHSLHIFEASSTIPSTPQRPPPRLS